MTEPVWHTIDATVEDDGPCIRIGIVDKWPWKLRDWRWFVRHPIHMTRAVKLYLAVNLLRRLDPQGGW